MEPLQETTPAGAPSVPVPPPVAVRWLHGTFHSWGPLVLLLLGGADKQGEDATASRGAGNEEAPSVGQLRLQHSLGSILVTAWQDWGVPASPWRHPARVPRSGLARWAGGLLAQPCGTRAPPCLDPAASGTGKGFSPAHPTLGTSLHSRTQIPSLGFFLCRGGWRKEETWEGGRSGWRGSPPPHPRAPTPLWAHILTTAEWPRDRPTQQLSAQPPAWGNKP